MKHFHKLADNLPVLPIYHAIARHPEWWDQDKTRTTFEGTPHAQVNDILLRFGKPDGNDLEATDREVMRQIPGLKALCLDIMRLVHGSRLGRVVVTKVEPGKRILPHADVKGEYAKYYTRYHVALQGLPGALFTCGDETVEMLTGQMWWFNAHETHAVRNNSPDDRVHLLIDIRVDD